MVTKLQEIINYKKEEFSFRRNQTNNFDLQSKIDKQKIIINDILPKYSYSRKDNFQKKAQINEPK